MAALTGPKKTFVPAPKLLPVIYTGASSVAFFGAKFEIVGTCALTIPQNTNGSISIERIVVFLIT